MLLINMVKQIIVLKKKASSLVGLLVVWSVVFYDTSNLIGYLISNPVHTCEINIYHLLLNTLKVILFLNESELICLHTVKWFQE